MVIQRSWKPPPIENLPHPSNSSDDSNGSNQTISSTNTNSSKSQNPKFVTTPQMAENVLSRLRQRFGSSTQIASSQKSSSEAVAVALELLRINVQSAFDKEIDSVVRKFMEMYFKPAFKNIKENLGDVVSDDVLQKMSCALLENSKSQYNTRKLQIATSSTESQSQLLSVTNLKRSSNETLSLDVAKKPFLQFQQQNQNKNQQFHQQQQQQQHQQQQQQTNTIQTAARRQIFWNTSNITIETQFLLDVQANQAFGFGTDGKERLASKHPELIRYLPDGNDRDWLVQQKIIPLQNRNSRFLFLVYDEVIKLGNTEQYRKKDNLNLNIYMRFAYQIL